MTPDEYRAFDAVGLAALRARKDVAARELVDVAIASIEAGDGSINAFVHRDFARAREAASALDANPGAAGPFGGVPFAIKDLNTTMEGLPATFGSALFKTAIAGEDSEIVRRYRAAGLIPLGLTNSPEFGMNVSTEPTAFGPTRNPRDPAGKLSAGGSSGGSGAAVAAGFVPAAHATDSAGSIRIPASVCGLIGLKPSRGRTPLLPALQADPHTITTANALTRTMRDCAALLRVASAAEPPADPLVDLASICDAKPRAPSRSLRCAQIVGGDGLEIDPACGQTANTCAAALAALGIAVEVISSPLHVPDLWPRLRALIAARMAGIVAKGRALAGDQAAPEPVVAELAVHGSALSPAEQAAAGKEARAHAARFAALFDNFDLVLTPTITKSAIPLGEHDPALPLETFFPAMMGVAGFAPLYNVAGMPAISLPIGQSDGSPVGAMLGAGAGAEEILLFVGAALEAAGALQPTRPNAASG